MEKLVIYQGKNSVEMKAIMLACAAAMAATVSTTSTVPSAVGSWTGELPGLPSNLLPQSPLLGNGELGVLLGNGEYQGPPPQADATRGPGAALPSLSFWLGSNAMWSVFNAQNGSALGPNRTAARSAVGGVTIGLASLLGDGAVVFTAEQRIGGATLHTKHVSVRGNFTTQTQLHPAKNVMQITCAWTPASAHVSGDGDIANVSVSTWTWSQMQRCTMVRGICRGLSPGWSHPLIVPTSVGIDDAAAASGLWVRRHATPANASSPHPVVATLATTIGALVGAPTTLRAQRARNADALSFGAEAVATLTLDCTVPSGFSVTTGVATLATEALSLRAALALARTPNAAATIEAARTKWWKAFWNASSISLPTQPTIERFWRGSQYILGSAVPRATEAAAAAAVAPGLFGPWVAWDVVGWNGDYTLDYNYEATFYGVYSSNHPELASSYFRAVVDAMGAARRGAAERASALNLTCASSSLHYNAHIGPWGAGDYDESWEVETGRHMHWNGAFAAMLFIHDWEYTRDVHFLNTTTMPLLRGLLEWWSCSLKKDPTTGELVDWPDQCAEGQDVANPQMAMAFIPRLASAYIAGSIALNSAIDPRFVSILKHISPPNTATNFTTNETMWTNFQGAKVQDSNMWSMYPLFPAEHVSLFSDPAVLQIARASSVRYSTFATGRPVQIFPAAVRAGTVVGDDDGWEGAGWSADEIVEGLNAFLNRTFGQSFVAYTSAGGIENVGVTRAINEMLLASGELPQSSPSSPPLFALELFAVWPKAEPAAFRALRGKGGFVVSASFRPNVGVESPVTIHSLAGERCALVVPTGWSSAEGALSVRVVCDGATLATTTIATTRGEAVVFTAPRGATCTVISATQRT